jgi:hypothetical protein
LNENDEVRHDAQARQARQQVQIRQAAVREGSVALSPPVLANSTAIERYPLNGRAAAVASSPCGAMPASGSRHMDARRSHGCP